MFYDEEGVGNRIGTRPIPRKKKHKNRLLRKKKKKQKKPLPELCIDTNKCTHLNFLLNQGKITHRAPPMVTYTAPIIKTAEPTFDLSKSSDETDVDYEKRLDTILKLKQPQLMMYYEAFKNKNNTNIATSVRELLRPKVPADSVTENERSGSSHSVTENEHPGSSDGSEHSRVGATDYALSLLDSSNIGEAPGILEGGASPQSLSPGLAPEPTPLAPETTPKRPVGRPPKSYGIVKRLEIEKEQERLRLERLGILSTMGEHFSGGGPRVPRAPSETQSPRDG